MLALSDPASEEKAPYPVQESRTSSVRDEKSSLISRNVTVGAHRTSVRLEPDMWSALREICRREHITHHDVATLVADGKADNTSLTAALRVFIMNYFRASSTEDGHTRAGHGPGGAFMTGLVSQKLEKNNPPMENRSQVINLRLSGSR